jgi:hypothetical protein
VAAIRGRYARDQKRLHGEESSAKQHWLEARDRVAELDTRLTSETADLQSRVWAAWHTDLSKAQQAAGVVDHGVGRFGQHRRLVHAATDELTEFAQRWRPVHPDLPTDPAELARQVKWLHRHRIVEQINGYAARHVAQAHPDADAARQAEHAARAAYESAQNARTRLDTTMHAELRPYGSAANITEPGQRLTSLTHQLGVVEHDLHTTTAIVHRIRDEPAIRTLPAGDLDTEHGQWAADRADQRQAAARDAQERWLRQQQTHRIRPTQPSHPALDHGAGIGR